jgi:hypothetical protein
MPAVLYRDLPRNHSSALVPFSLTLQLDLTPKTACFGTYSKSSPSGSSVKDTPASSNSRRNSSFSSKSSCADTPASSTDRRLSAPASISSTTSKEDRDQVCYTHIRAHTHVCMYTFYLHGCMHIISSPTCVRNISHLWCTISKMLLHLDSHGCIFQVSEEIGFVFRATEMPRDDFISPLKKSPMRSRLSLPAVSCICMCACIYVRMYLCVEVRGYVCAQPLCDRA